VPIGALMALRWALMAVQMAVDGMYVVQPATHDRDVGNIVFDLGE
jgi:hypothetical protein